MWLWRDSSCGTNSTLWAPRWSSLSPAGDGYNHDYVDDHHDNYFHTLGSNLITQSDLKKYYLRGSFL